MKKLFVSVPMVGRSDEAIEKSISRMKKIAEAYWNEEFEVIDTMAERNCPECKNKRLWYLGGSIQMMCDADYFIGVETAGVYHIYDRFPGVLVEECVARDYGIEMFLLPFKEICPDVVIEEE